jgi:hypothetical protein
MSVMSVECESLDSTGDGSTVAGYGEGGGASESLSDPVDALYTNKKSACDSFVGRRWLTSSLSGLEMRWSRE